VNTARLLYAMMRADFLERTRRYSFLIMLLAVVFLGYSVNSGTIQLYLGEYRGVYNSPWVCLITAEPKSSAIRACAGRSI
jgi:hypothetical protein